MALVRSPSFGEDEFDGAMDDSTMATSNGTPKFSSRLRMSSEGRPLRLEVDQIDAPSSVGTLSGTPTSKHSARTLPDNPCGTPPRLRGSSIPSKSPTGSGIPSYSSTSRSPVGRSSPAPHFGTDGTHDLPSWKFQNNAADENRSEARRRDWSPERTVGAERAGYRDRTHDLKPDMNKATSLKAFAMPLPVSPSQPIDCPVELSPRRTPSANFPVVSAESPVSPVTKPSRPSITIESHISPKTKGFSRPVRTLVKQTSSASRSAASSSSAFLVPQDLKPQTLKKSAPVKNQFTFIRMMEGNKALLQRSVTVEEVAKHNKRSDCWIILSGKVYDVTSYLAYHPGGKSGLFQCAGRDATKEYAENHPWVNYEQLIGKLCVGPLASSVKSISLER